MAKEPPEPLRTFLVNRYGSSLYNQLYDADANLSYLWLLDVWLQVADSASSILARPSGPGARAKRSRQRKAEKDAISTRAHKVLQAYFQGYLAGAKQSDANELLLHANHPKFYLRINELYHRVMPRIMEYLQNQIESELYTSTPSTDSVDGENELRLADVFREYSPPAWKYEKGGTQDLRGSFFLLAVTEHLGRRRGRYRLAHRLIRTIRGLGKEPRRRSGAERAKKRIQRLMNTHPKWKTHVDLVNQFWLARQ